MPEEHLPKYYDFQVLVNELLDNKMVVLENYKLGDPLETSDIDIIEQKYQVSIPEQIKSFFRQHNGLAIKWHLNKSHSINYINSDFPDELWGNIHIYDLDTVLGGEGYSHGWHNVLWFDHMDEEDKIEHQKLRIFDLSDPYSAECACFELEEGELIDDLVLHSVDDGITPLIINLETYLDSMIMTKGMIGWQKALVFESSLERAQFLHYMPQIFPGSNLSRFQN